MVGSAMLITRAAKAVTRAAPSLTRTAITGSTITSGLTHSRFHSACLNRAMVPSLSTDSKTTSSTTPDPLFHYSQALSTPLPAKFAELHAHSVQQYPATADKTVSDLQGQFLRLLMRMTRPRRVLELGCFMGYSAMAMADGMTSDGALYTCEKDPQAAQLARELFDKEGYSSKASGKAVIELLEGDAMASLETLAKNQLQFDAIFIDADKGGYIRYYERIMESGLLSKDGFILADNVLFRGMVLNSNIDLPSPPPSPTLSPKDGESKKRSKSSLQKTANHMDAFNRHVRSDPRVEAVVLPIFDGLSVIMHKST